MKESFLSWAKYYKKLGFNPVPCRAESKAPLGSWGLYNTTEVTEEQLKEWAEENDTRNIGSVAGDVTNYCIVDVDGGGYEYMQTHGLVIPNDTPVVWSGGVTVNKDGTSVRDRYHLYYTINGNEELLRGIGRIPEILEGSHIELRIKNCFTILPPSTHVTTGFNYEWLNGQTPDIEMQPLPKWVVDAVLLWKTANKLEGKKEIKQDIVHDIRNDTLYDIANRMFYATIKKSAAYDLLYEINEERVNPPESPSTIHTIINSAYDTIKRSNDKKFEFNDTGNAHRYIQMYGENTKFGHESKYFLNYNGKYWAEDKLDTITHGRCLHVVQTIKGECSSDADDKIKEAYRKFAVSCGNIGKLDTMKQAIAKFCTVAYEECDSNPWLFNVSNGTIDLKTGTLLPHNKADMITKCSGVVYDKEATCPMFKEFLNKIFLNDVSLINYVQSVLGYSLSGDTSEQKIFIMKGTGGNGKSTLMNVLMKIMGNYAVYPRMDTFVLGKGSETGRNDLANIRGARLANAAEPNKGVFFDMELLKKISGGEAIRCRYLYSKGEMEYDPTYKVIIQCNHLPNIQSNGDSSERRFRVIPFNFKVNEKDRDEQLVEKLLEESSGILNWLIEGCRLMYTRPKGNKLPACAAVDYESKDYMQDQDPIGTFLKLCTTHKVGARTWATDLHTAYEIWAPANNGAEFKKTSITKCVKEHGVKSDHGDRGTFFFDIELNGVNKITSF